MLDPAIFMQAVMHSKEGITISDANQPDNPLIFVNKAFEEMTGYSSGEVINRNCRFLQGNKSNQRNIKVVREAIENAKSCLVTLRNYRKDGSMFWNELSISPVFDTQGKLTHFIGIQKDVTARVKIDQFLYEQRKSIHEIKAKIEKLVITDSLTGIYNQRHLKTKLNEFWQFPTDTQGALSLMMVDIDYFKLYNDDYGHVAGEEVLRKVASALTASMRRQTDFTACYEGEKFVVLATDMTKQQTYDLGNTLCVNVRNLNIPHKGSPDGYVTVSCGTAQAHPISSSSTSLLLLHADKALSTRKTNGGNQATKYDNLGNEHEMTNH